MVCAMAFFSAAGAGIIKTVADYFVEPVARRVKYLTHTNSKLKKLKTSVQDLVAAREGLKSDIDQAVRNGERVRPDVELWETRVDEITGKAKEILEDEHHAKTKCLHGYCPNLILRYKVGKESTKLRDEILVKLDAGKNFPSLTFNIIPQDVCISTTRENTTSDSRISTLKEIMEELRSPDTEIILVYGIPGVGKTTLAQDVLSKAIDDKLFDDVVMVRDVKENPDLGRIQKEIATKLGMEVHTNQTVHERALFLCDRLKDKNTLVILDDVWEALDLFAVGIPCVVTCKILMTCRIQKVMSTDYREQKEFPLDILGEEDAWSLFEKMAGDVVKKDHRIREIARQVANRCGGLPLLLVTVASSLKKSNTLPPWEDTLRRLKEIANEGLTKKTYSSIEWSYNQLNEELQPLFLLCGTSLSQNSRQNSVSLSDLLKYGMGLDLFQNVKTIKEARNALYTLVEKLKDFCLLLEGNDNSCVRMHDLVRDVVLSIAFKDAHAFSVTGVLKEWPTNSVLEKCRSISLDHCHIPRLPEVLPCPELEMFCLVRNMNGVRQEFPSNFFQEVIKLKVLDLTGVSLTPSLPLSLQFLKNLRTLCLDYCELGDISLVGQMQSLEILSFQFSKFQCLPSEIGHLTSLRLLDLTNCRDLEVISPNVLASLKMLEDLRMRNSFKKWEDERFVGERRNASLSELKHLSQLTALQIHIPDASSLPADLFSNMSLERYHICIGDSVVWKHMIRNTSTLNTLILKFSICDGLDSGLQMLLKKSEVLCLDGTSEGTDEEGFSQQTNLFVINSKVQLSNLTILEVDGCNNKFLLSSSTARSLIQLEHLHISSCPLLEGIISKAACDEESGADIMFPKLECVKLIDLPNLTRFFSGNYIEFPSFQISELVKCPKLGESISDPVVSEDNIMGNEVALVDSEKNLSLDDNISVSLFDGKVRLPRLKTLNIKGLPTLMTIWHNQLPHDYDFQNLNSVEVHGCDSLRYVFPASLVVRGLQQLERLVVRYCNQLEEIIAKDEGVESTPPEFLFPKVSFMDFHGLRKVRNFYSGMHTFKVPLLKHLAVVDIGAEENHEDYRSLMFLFQDSFLNLEKLTLSGGKIWSEVVSAEAGLFSNLKSICFVGWSPFSDQDAAALVFLQKLHNLEEIEEHLNATVDHGNGSRSMEIHAVHIPFPRVTTLKLHCLYRLMIVGGNLNSHPEAGPVLPNLETLVVECCSSLKNLESSAISFRNLISLTVHGCTKLEYLITYEIAKSFVQLTTLKVSSCEVMTEIVRVSSNADDGIEYDDACQIAFERLKDLELVKLPRMEGLCSRRNCIVKFPSLKTLRISEHLNKLNIVPHNDGPLWIREIED